MATRKVEGPAQFTIDLRAILDLARATAVSQGMTAEDFNGQIKGFVDGVVDEDLAGPAAR